MLEREAPGMNNYAEINPYSLIYCNMNIHVTEDVTREVAENVVRQIGFLHNTMGCVFKDLIKILAYRFPSHPQPQHPQYAHTQHTQHTHAQPQAQHAPQALRSQAVSSNRQPMEVEEAESYQSRPQKSRSRPAEERHRAPAVVVVEPAAEPEEKPANASIFDEYAYSKDGQAIDFSSIKLGLAKVIDVAQRTLRDRPDKLLEKPADRTERPADKAAEKTVERREASSEGEMQPSVNPMRELFSRPMSEAPQDSDIFSEFVYESKAATPKAGSKSQVWELVRAGKGAQPVYEISDDEGA